MPAAYFDAIYDAAAEPWLAQANEEDRQKHLATLAALPGVKYRHGLEVGCGTGLLTEHLAGRCDRLLGIDLAQAALVRASARLKGKRHVRLACRAFPGELQTDTPPDGFDLVVLSEVLYYLDAQALARAARVTRALTARGGHVQLVNWFAPSDDLPLSGNEAAELFIAALRPVAPVLLQVRTADYRIDVLQL
jgi:predicted TPR repeat methyltransferase